MIGCWHAQLTCLFVNFKELYERKENWEKRNENWEKEIFMNEKEYGSKYRIKELEVKQKLFLWEHIYLW